MNKIFQLSFRVIFLTLLFNLNITHAIELKKGVISGDASWNELTEKLYESGFYPYSVVETGGLDGNEIYVYDEGLGRKKINSSSFLGAWIVDRWAYLVPSKEQIAAYDRTTIKITSDSVNKPVYIRVGKLSIGCMSKYPLRYGTFFESENDKYIVLLLNYELILFSVEHKRIVFAEFFDSSDWVSGSDPSIDSLRDPQEYQYLSSIAYGANGSVFRGTRSYSKVFRGNFDGDNNPDILVWRKIYQSNTLTDPAQGFSIIRDEWQHYEQDLDTQADYENGVTGEFIPQQSTPEIVKEWLLESDLTWADGYPRRSECDGEDRQLIPEMHDRLLNDPDVLK